VEEVTNQPQGALDPARSTPNEDALDPLKKVQGWVGALTAASLLIAIGFISRISREQFLGISPGDWDVSSLSLSAGRCFVDSVLIPIDFLLSSFFDHPYRTAARVFVLFCLAVVGWCLRGRRFTLELFRYSLLSVLCLSLTFVLLAYELPTVPLTNWLSAPLPTVPCDFSGQSNQMTAIGCVTRTAQVLAASKMHDDFDNTKMGALYKFDMTSDQARGAIIRHYSVTALICLFSWLWFLFSLPLRRLTARDRFFSLASVAVFLMLALATGFVPYMYGKLIQSTEFPDAEVSFREVQAKGGKKEAHAKQAQEEVITDEFAVLSKGDKSISLILAKPTIFKIREVSLERVLYIRFYGSVDPLEIALKKQIPLKPEPRGAIK
jgi:hypothetical protein